MDFFVEYAKILKISIDIYSNNGNEIKTIDIELIEKLYKDEKIQKIISPLYHSLKGQTTNIFFEKVLSEYSNL